MSGPVRISFHTQGCRLNRAESASLENRFQEAGYKVVEIDEPADVVVINTCTVTEHGDADTRRLVHRLHKRSAESRIALIGCQSQVQGENLLKLPGVKWVIGTAAKMDLLQIFQQYDGAEPVLLIPEIPRHSFTLESAAIDRRHTRANLKIQDGCDFFCSFCEIPYARGRARSREFDDLLREAHELAAAGYHELVLTGINVGTYAFEGKSILDVVSALAGIGGIWRIRVSSIEMTTIPDGMFSMMGAGKVCRYLHVPLQSGSEGILHAMRRRHSPADFTALCEAAIARVPDICIGTDVMVGFPGESDDDFQRSRQLLSSLPVAYFHVFSYSDRQHSHSRKATTKVTEAVKQQRSRILRQLSLEKRQAFFERFIGTTAGVLFESEKDGWWTGLTDHYIRVRVRSEEHLANRLRPVQLEAIDHLTMTGILL